MFILRPRSIFGFIISCVAIVALYHFGNIVKLQWRSESYTATRGVIVDIGLHRREYEDSDSIITTYYYSPRITYEYTVGGETHQSATFRYGQPPIESEDRSEIEAWLESYAIGDEIRVYYDPDQPGESVLETGLDPWDFYFVLILIPLVLFALSGIVAVVQREVFRNRREQAPNAVRVRRRKDLVRVYPPADSAIAKALLLASYIGVITAIVLSVRAAGEVKPHYMASMFWLLGISVVVIWPIFFLAGLGRGRDIILDETDRAMVLPKSEERAERLVIPVGQVQQIYQNSKPGRFGKATITVEWRDGRQVRKDVAMSSRDAPLLRKICLWLDDRVRTMREQPALETPAVPNAPNSGEAADGTGVDGPDDGTNGTMPRDESST